MPVDEAERLRRWRLVLGGEAGPAGAGAGLDVALSGADAGMDRVLGALYGSESSERQAGLDASAPRVNRWLGDIRTYFPAPVVRVLQQDALERLGLRRMLLEPELLAAVEPDVHLVATLLSLNRVLPERTRETARAVVRQVVEELERRLYTKTVQAVRGSLHRAARTTRPRPQEIDWDRTIRANLKHYQPAMRTIIPEKLIGYGHKRRSLRDIILCIDQSGSMATSVIYSSIFGAALASLRALNTRLVVFDTAVVDLTDELHDPVELLFGTQLGGGTDINRALAYCQGVIARPADTILVLITDLYEGGNGNELLKRAAALVGSGVQMVCLLALNDQGAPIYHERRAAALAALGVPAFACTPDLFPELLAAAIQRRDLTLWASRQGIVAARAG
ncbi:MAG TPA: VWA domain-containing protein [Thermomicrobiaceae bacterium]|nr:VWA domain-containing protein [Thermomicrobiaceae bacterium]